LEDAIMVDHISQ